MSQTELFHRFRFSLLTALESFAKLLQAHSNCMNKSIHACDKAAMLQNLSQYFTYYNPAFHSLYFHLTLQLEFIFHRNLAKIPSIS